MKKIIQTAVYIFLTLGFLQNAAAEELTFLTINAWSAAAAYETENDAVFRHEILVSGLKEQQADIIVLNGLNPADRIAGETAAALGMSWVSRVAKSSLRVGPVSLPPGLKEGDAVLAAEGINLYQDKVLHMDGVLGGERVTLFSRNGVQVLGCRIESGDTELYLFSTVWSESLFDDEQSLTRMLSGYLDGSISAEKYTEGLADAVAGAEKRREQAAQTLSFVNSVAGESPAVIMGSLNALPESPELALLTEAGFIDAFEAAGPGSSPGRTSGPNSAGEPGFTLDTAENTHFANVAADDEDSFAAALSALSGRYRTDYILVRGAEIKPVSAEIVLNEAVYGVYPSNRFGVKAVIEFPSNLSEQ